MRNLALSLAALVLLCLTTLNAQQSLQFSLDSDTCYPGDLVILKANYSDTALFELELKLEQSADQYHLVDTHSAPIRYEDDQYHQQTTWVVQPLASGSIVFSEIKAAVSRSGTVNTLDFIPARLTVLNYSETDESLALQELPSATLNRTAAPLWWILLSLLPFAWVLAEYLRRHRKQLAQPRTPSPADPLAQLLMQLDDPEALQASARQILADGSFAGSNSLRQALERVAYGKDSDLAELSDSIRKEVQG
ncbi:hypothetical protein [Coraliomargarita akajimensis]|uniref:Protein BatD n=1 Tax=Coraliomargarita akajimensis (strain DSM 45221 / IAM 15411 / JCM 23193 / KCTC 12865 / 04OKA010-24) TaxID=583355 RepID=D5ENV9_CORAD|nr:hypothetical protein [Coraliomargarita akajimensis]ADE53618.1 hypothetical protein Caka_0593 [Coraliomargarita akajimensis DSM 45221]